MANTTTADRLNARRMRTTQGKRDAEYAQAQLQQLDGMLGTLTHLIETKRAENDWSGEADLVEQRRLLADAYTIAWVMSGRKHDDLPDTLHGVRIEK